MTEEALHVTAFVIASEGLYPKFLVPPSDFIHRARRYKQKPYKLARQIFRALGQPVPNFPTPGSGQPEHMMSRLQEVWREMRKGED